MIDKNRWYQYTFYQQMGNIASELNRAVRFDEIQDTLHLEAALWRVLELVDLTKEDPQNKKRLKELCRLKEVLVNWYCGTNEYTIRPESLKNYAMNFTLLAKKAGS